MYCRAISPSEVSELHAGDIGALAKLTAARTGISLSTKATTIKYGKFDISTPYTYMRYKPKNKADVDKISQALQKMTHEDLTIRVVNDAENRQTLLYGMGDQHLDIVVSRLLNEYKVEIELSSRRSHTKRPSRNSPMWNISTRNSPADTVSTVM